MYLALLTVVITGPVPVIHTSWDANVDGPGPMDGRIKSGHDDQF
jgi:hypothetical protein